MTSKQLNQYAEFRRSIFDPKGDLDPIPFVAQEGDLLNAARTMGQVEGLTPLIGGSFNSAFRFDTPEGSFVLRVPHDERLAPGLMVERWAIEVASARDFPVSIPVFTDTSRYVAPFSFQILHYLEKTPHTEVSYPGPLNRLARIHSISLSGYGPIDPRSLDSRPQGLHTSWWAFVNTNLEEHCKRCVEMGAMTDAEWDRVDEIMYVNRDNPDSVLLHNDLSSSNLIGGRWVDWESCIAGDPLWEMASLCAFQAARPVQSFIEASPYRGCDMTRFWTYYLRIVIARTVHRARFGIHENPVYPKASARIQLALSHLS